MEKIYCPHCGLENDNDIITCPKCNSPMQVKENSQTEKKTRQFKYYFIALVIFCFAVIYYAPRVLPGN